MTRYFVSRIFGLLKYQFENVQITFAISADDGKQVAMFGRIEKPRNPDLVTVPATTITVATTTTTTTVLSADT